MPSRFSNFRGVLEDIDEQAETVVPVFSGRTLETLFTAFVRENASGSIDLRGNGALPGSVGLGLFSRALNSEFDELTAERIQEEANIRGLTSRYYWNQYDNPINDKFVSSFEEDYGTLPAMFAGGTFAAGSEVAQAVEETGSQDPDDIAQEMRGMTIQESPKGEGAYVFQEHNNQAKSPMTIANLVPTEEENWGADVMPGEPLMTVGADEAALPEDDPEMTCDLTNE